MVVMSGMLDQFALLFQVIDAAEADSQASSLAGRHERNTGFVQVSDLFDDG
jgi:hypothetical protein